MIERRLLSVFYLYLKVIRRQKLVGKTCIWPAAKGGSVSDESTPIGGSPRDSDADITDLATDLQTVRRRLAPSRTSKTELSALSGGRMSHSKSTLSLSASVWIESSTTHLSFQLSDSLPKPALSLLYSEPDTSSRSMPAPPPTQVKRSTRSLGGLSRSGWESWLVVWTPSTSRRQLLPKYVRSKSQLEYHCWHLSDRSRSTCQTYRFRCCCRSAPGARPSGGPARLRVAATRES